MNAGTIGIVLLAPAFGFAQAANIASKAGPDIHASLQTAMSSIDLQTISDIVLDLSSPPSALAVTYRMQGQARMTQPSATRTATPSQGDGNAGANQAPHQVSAALIIGIMVMGPVFVWFLLRKGYSNRARVLGFGWASLVLALSQLTPQDNTQGERARTQTASAALTPAATPVAPVPSTASIEESDYLDLLDGSLDEIRRNGLVYQDPSPQVAWAASLNTIGALGTNFLQGKDIKLSPAGTRRQQAWRHEIAMVQAKTFPRLRVLQAKALDEKLWELDVRVAANGPAYSVLRLTGYQFAANRNIKRVMEMTHENALASRFRRVEFQAYRGGELTYYTLDPLPDTALATFAFNRWTKVD